jgi:hypothetical protein
MCGYVVAVAGRRFCWLGPFCSSLDSGISGIVVEIPSVALYGIISVMECSGSDSTERDWG